MTDQTGFTAVTFVADRYVICKYRKCTPSKCTNMLCTNALVQCKSNSKAQVCSHCSLCTSKCGSKMVKRQVKG